MADDAHVSLIVDNPLRDLEGLVLLGRQLATRGARVTLVPMYDQGFDVPALRPDLVLLNYTRPNNADLIKSYKRAGILVGVLDTEGMGGKSADQFAGMVKATGCPDLVDLYCVWGEAQRTAFLQHATVPETLLFATGCPRYDFCAPPWRSALSKPSVAPGYVLINTNFPVVNPRFSNNSLVEEQSMVKAGFSREFARRFIVDARDAYRRALETAIELARMFPDERFVLRPHPFENIHAYDAFAELPNAQVIQSGTSLEWISGASLLIHQNCSTAIEAIMLHVEPLSMEWFNTPALRLDAATQVSRPAASSSELANLVREALNRGLQSPAHDTVEFRRKIIRDLFTSVDGASSARVSDAVLQTIANARGKIGGQVEQTPRPSGRGMAADAIRAALGYRLSSAVRRSYGSKDEQRRRLGKAFSIELVNAILQRLDSASGDTRRFFARVATAGSTRTRTMSGASLELTQVS